MEQIGSMKARKSWRLLSGAAKGADSAFEAGCVKEGGAKTIILPKAGWEGRRGPDYLVMTDAEREQAEAYLAKVLEPLHLQRIKASDFAYRAHTRNVWQVLGPDFQSPVQHVICWCPKDSNGRLLGGTATAVKLADNAGIRVYNLWHLECLEWMRSKLDAHD